MPTTHLDGLLAAAVDGVLGPLEERRVRDHLEACDACRRAYAEQRRAAIALRQLPFLRMPRAVVLPASPPQLEPGPTVPMGRRWTRWWGWRPAAAAAALAAAAVLAAVAVRGLLQQPTPTATGVALPPATAAPLAGGAALSPACPAGDFAVAASPWGASPPPGFAAATSVPVPGGTVVLAAPRASYRPGDTVLVYARLILAGGGSLTAVVPCVSLRVESTGAPDPRGGAGGAPWAASAAPPVAVATATQGRGAEVLLLLTIPTSLPTGSVVDVVAIPPPGSAGEATGGRNVVLRLRIG